MLKELPKIGVSGEYKLQLSKKGCAPHTDTGFFKNLILDNGLNGICSASELSSGNFSMLNAPGSLLFLCFVGSGNTTPTASDTQLVARVGSTNSVMESYSASSEFSRGYAELVVVYRFNAGTVVGNLSEVGVGPSGTSLFSRALILDSEGSPTTITVTADDILTVTYRLRLSIPQIDTTQIINVDSSGVLIPTTVTIRSLASNYYPMNNTTAFSFGIKRSFGASTPLDGVVTGSNSDLVPAASNTLTSTERASGVSMDAYVNNSFKRTAVATFSTTVSNRNIAVFAYSFGPGCFQVKFDPPLQKTNQLALRLSFGFQVARA